MKLKGSKTAYNLMAAFAGEAQARDRYTYYASKARQEGYVQMADIFEETANQEREHAKRLFNLMPGGDPQEIKESFPCGPVGTTLENLKAAAAGEHHEYSEMYPDMAKVAEAEGFPEIASVFRNIAVAEKQHEKRYLDLAANIENNRVFKREDARTVWRCRNCGWLHTGADAPDKCLACAHPKAHFEILGENW